MNQDPIKLSHQLLDSQSQGQTAQSAFSACLNAYGLYHSTQFVLRLSPVVHLLVESATKKNGVGITSEEIQAFSTYVHETVHWWQHIGTTIGFIMSMCYPTQTHLNLDPLRHLAKVKEAKKPLKTWAEDKQRLGHNHTNPDIAQANIAINNTMDMEYYKIAIIHPQRLKIVARDAYFENLGHSFRMAYDSTLSTLKSIFDPNSNFLPDPDTWFKSFEKLKTERIVGYYHGSDIYLSPLSGLDILEGQARFIQLQFLSFSNSQHIKFADAERDGYFKDEYGNAFRLFLSRTKSPTPHSIDSPLIGLFLLICDIALNPSEGFPLAIHSPESFIYHADCNHRFLALCDAVNKHPELKHQIKDYSKNEYLQVAHILTSECNINHPYIIPETIKEWQENEKTIQELLKEQKDFSYNEESMVIRVLFSHFITFNLDKFESPELFCWTGACLSKKEKRSSYEKKWLNNLSLFTDNAEENTIFPRLFPDKPAENIKQTFNSFYASNIVYDIVRQWTVDRGPFKYDFSWLTEQHESRVVEEKAKSLFQNLYGINPDEIKY